mmetsp:Transcript_80641/g.179137  ORF Transcript_80641/g.179137 Transcript_80641/m.179137 type:complete len:336 (-) Transcript_80641:86-1093(-)
MWLTVLAALAVIFCALHLLWLRLTRPLISITGRHVLITGGSQGLGKSLAELCFRRGARVTIVARTAGKLQQACDEIRQSAQGSEGRIQYLTLDVSSAKCEDINRLMQEAAESFGRIDVFVSNAGSGNAALLLETPLAEAESLMEGQISVNLLGGLRSVICAAQRMASDGKGGRISIVSSAAGLISLPGYAIYSATKFGHRGFLAGAYHEFLRYGVRLSVYYPGSIRTPGFAAEQEAVPRVTAKIEAQCSDISSSEAAAEVLLNGILRGSHEITNELLPLLTLDMPTGCAPIDAAIAFLVQLIRAGWFMYLKAMSSLYIEGRKPVSASASEPGKQE